MSESGKAKTEDALVERRRRAEVKASRAAEETKRRAKQAKPEKRSHETQHEFH